MKKLIVISVMIGLMALPAMAVPTTYSFTHISEPGDGAAQIANGLTGEAQLFVDVDTYLGNQVLFTFRNVGPVQSVIKGIYFDDGTLLSLASVINGTGVSFTQESLGSVTPGDLPAGNNLDPDFEVTEGFLADADNPSGSNKNGVDPGQSVGIVFTLKDLQDISDVLDELGTGELRIGIHVGSFPNGGSETFVNNGSVVPAPGAVLLGGIGVSIVGWLRRRRAL